MASNRCGIKSSERRSIRDFELPKLVDPASGKRTKAVAAAAEQRTERGLYLGDAVRDRLDLKIRHRGSTDSAVAETILGMSLSRPTLNR